jgi:hypothetical protein
MPEFNGGLWVLVKKIVGKMATARFQLEAGKL